MVLWKAYLALGKLLLYCRDDDEVGMVNELISVMTH